MLILLYMFGREAIWSLAFHCWKVLITHSISLLVRGLFRFSGFFFFFSFRFFVFFFFSLMLYVSGNCQLIKSIQVVGIQWFTIPFYSLFFSYRIGSNVTIYISDFSHLSLLFSHQA